MRLGWHTRSSFYACAIICFPLQMVHAPHHALMPTPSPQLLPQQHIFTLTPVPQPNPSPCMCSHTSYRGIVRTHSHLLPSAQGVAEPLHDRLPDELAARVLLRQVSNDGLNLLRWIPS